MNPKHFCSFLSVVFGPLVASGQIVPGGVPWMHQSGTKFAAAADINADGLTDAVMLDAATGTYVVGAADIGGGLVWSAPVSVGFRGVTAATVGKLAPGQFCLAVGSPDFNNVQVAVLGSGDLLDVMSFSQPFPTTLAAVSKSGPTGDSLLAAGFESDGWPGPLVGSTPGSVFPHWQNYELGANPRFANAVYTRPNRAPALGVMTEDVSGLARLQVFHSDESQAALAAEWAPLPAGSRFVHGNFAADAGPIAANHHSTTLVSWVPGQNDLRTGRLSSVDSMGMPLEDFEIFPLSLFPMGRPIRQVQVLLHPGGHRLLVSWSDAAGGASVFQFDGTTAPVLVEALDLNGMELDAFLPLGPAGNFLAMGKRGGVPVYDHFAVAANPNHYSAVASGPMPAVPAGTLYSNVIAYSGEPMVDPAAKELKRGRVRDWTVSATVGAGSASVFSLLDAGPVSGLGSPLALPFLLPSQASHLLTSQLRPAASLLLLSDKTTSQAAMPDFTLLPPPGTYPPLAPNQGFPLKIITKGGPITRYSVNGGPWSYLARGQELVLTTDSTIRAYAEGFSYSKGPVRTLSYQFAAAPPIAAVPLLDLDQNGLSDSWEQLTGIQSPGGDSDGDGYLNLAEHNSGSDPLSSASVPPPAALPLALDLVQTETPSGNSALRWSASDPAVLLMESTDLAGWNPVVQGIRTEGNMKVFDLPMSTVRRSFYHLRR